MFFTNSCSHNPGYFGDCSFRGGTYWGYLFLSFGYWDYSTPSKWYIHPISPWRLVDPIQVIYSVHQAMEIIQPIRLCRLFNPIKVICSAHWAIWKLFDPITVIYFELQIFDRKVIYFAHRALEISQLLWEILEFSKPTRESLITLIINICKICD